MTLPRALDGLIDDGFEQWWPDDLDRQPDGPRPADPSSVVTGRATVAGRPVAVIASRFDVVAGTMGIGESSAIGEAFDRAGQQNLPVVAVVASGGIRLQQGAAAFVGMISTTLAAVAYRRQAGPFIAYLSGATTGGVFASWVSMAQVTIARPGVLVGLVGPRASLDGSGDSGAARSDIGSVEDLVSAGVLDGVAEPESVREHIIALLELTAQGAAPSAPIATPPASPSQELDIDTTTASTRVAAARSSWDSVIASRDDARPGARALIRSHIRWVVPPAGGSSAATPCFTGLGRLADRAVAIVGHDRRFAGERPVTAEDYRAVRRMIAVADQLELPLLSIIDTAGEEMTSPDPHLPRLVAECIAGLAESRSPTVALLLGAGAGAGAMALLPADCVIAAGGAWLSPLPPERAAAVLFKDRTAGREAAELMRIGAQHLYTQGIVDVVVDEPPDPADSVTFAQRLVATAVREIDRLGSIPPDERLPARMNRLRGCSPRTVASR